jgi:dTDP-4-amino-4,6-dideoxygalactose transaminase
MANGTQIYLSSPHMSEEGYEWEFIREAFDTNWIAPVGRNVDEFEKEMAEKLGVKEAVALNSGTAAIHLALKSAGVNSKDIVFCQSLTFSASANPITYLDATPVFIDSEIDTWNMSPDSLETAFKQYPNAKAVILVHLYGMAAKIDEIKEICRKYGAVLIEDAAESLGTIYKGKYTGSFGDYGILSFNGNKIITSSAGGMLIVNTFDAKRRAQKVRFWSTQSRDPARHYQHSEIGYNYRMSNIVAGIGRGQLKVLDKRVDKKRYEFTYYKKALYDLPGIELAPMIGDPYVRNNCWLSVAQLSGNVSPDMIIDALSAKNIESRPVWKPMHMQPVFAGCDYFDNGAVSQKLFENGVCLPSDTKMHDRDLEKIVSIVRECCGEGEARDIPSLFQASI